MARTRAVLLLGALATALHGCPEPSPAHDAAVDGDAVTGLDAACDPAAPPSAVCPVCQPGAVSCTDDARGVHTCAVDGLAFGATTPCDAARGELCAEGACVEPCAWAARASSYQGCEFFAVGTLNSTIGHNYEGTSREDFPFAVAVANPWPVEVRVTLEGGGLPGAVVRSVGPLGTAVFNLPWVLALAEGGRRSAIASTVAREGAVRLRSSAPLSAYQFNPLGFVSSTGCEGPPCYSYSNDASLLLPAATLRRQYMVVTRPTVRLRPADGTSWTVSPGFIAVVGTTDTPADVTVRLRGRTAAGAAAGIPAGSPGEVITQRLARGEVLQLLSANSSACAEPEPDPARGDIYCRPVLSEDLTGTLVESSQPVAVFAGHDCALVPHDRYACDHLEEQVFPTESLGTRYILARTPPAASEPDLVRIVATRDLTELRFDPPGVHAPVTIARAGEFVEFEQREAFELVATQPVLVAQFLVGANYDPARFGGLGDPDMVLAVPAAQYRRSYAFIAAPGFGASRAIATVPRGERIVLDGRLVAEAPTARVADFDIYELLATAGPHRLEAARPAIRFGLVVSGLADYASYTYPGGLDLAPIAPPL